MTLPLSSLSLIGLLQGSGYICSMMTIMMTIVVIGMMMMMMKINFLNGTMVIKNVSLNEELLPIAWHSSRYWDWCVPEDDKKETEKLWR